MNDKEATELQRDLELERARSLARSLIKQGGERDVRIVQLRNELTQLEEDREYNASLVMERDKELARLRKRLATTVQRCGYCDYEATGIDAFDAVAEHIKSCPKHPLARALAELAQARRELGCLQGASREYERQLAAVKENRDYWYETCLSAESERDKWRKKAQAQSDEVQRDWLSPENTKGAQQRIDDLEAKRDHWLRKYCESERKAEEGLESLTETLRRKVRHAESEHDYWLKAHDESQRQLAQVEAQRDRCLRECDDLETKLLERPEEAEVSWASPDEIKVVAGTPWVKEQVRRDERLATLDAAEAALADCWVNGIHDAFNDLPDAIKQMAQHIKELSSRLTQAQADLDAEPIEVEITGREMVEALRAERRLRTVVETQAHVLSMALDECTQTVHTERQLRQTAEQRAERAEAANRILWDQDTERAEALAQLMNEETVALLERLADVAEVLVAVSDGAEQDGHEARALAAKIREILDGT